MGSSFRQRLEKNWDGLVAYAVAANAAGVECLSGIPGTVGGTPVQNVGAYGQEVSQTIVTVRAFDRKALRFIDLPATDCGFSYRRSIFNSTERERYVVTRVDYSLRKDGLRALFTAQWALVFTGSHRSTLWPVEHCQQPQLGKSRCG
ncbi:MAG: UDP-N-acetylmuramate dehydrogenase [Acidobacteriaceae bacterium]|jgi:UDP-N-acetylmuramate dehydrogenase|nr:UDP-N-acetylmuramate dehydrogenase [Acidobacteriaceae bacterium]